MNHDDPFADLSGNDSTVFIKPIPGGIRRPPVPGPATAPSPGWVRSTEDASLPPRLGLNPLETAASPLLLLLTRLKNMPSHPDPDGLLNQVIEAVKDFEAKALSIGVNSQTVLAARYVLCTALDEVVLNNTPWGHTSQWRRQGLLITFHKEAWGGEKFFTLLDKLLREPGNNLHLLELMYICLCLGFQGRFRVIDGGYNQLEAVRDNLFHTLRHQRGDFERELSPHWKGIVDKRNPLIRYVPLWVVSALACILLVGIYSFLSINLNRASDPVFADLYGIGKDVVTPVVPPPPKPAPPPVVATPGLPEFLAPEIRQELVSVEELADRTVVLLRGDNLFRSGSATVNSAYQPLLERIAAALKTVPGQVLVTGHTDNIPIRTLRFPSNWHLSQQRAESVVTLLTEYTGTPERFTAEGRADAEPVDSNKTPEGRARNRRVEIHLLSSGGAT